MKIDRRIGQLIAVGASVAANCQQCLEYNTGKALECGADAQQIAAAIEIGKRVRKGAAAKMDQFMIRSNLASHPHESAADKGCGCNSL